MYAILLFSSSLPSDLRVQGHHSGQLSDAGPVSEELLVHIWVLGTSVQRACAWGSSQQLFLERKPSPDVLGKAQMAKMIR